MATKKKQRQRQRCKIMEAIKTIEKVASMAMKIYRAIKPIVKGILSNGRKIK
jgi:hypothetical protein